MARIKLQNQDTENQNIKNIFDEIKKSKWFIPAPYRAFWLMPNILEANWNKTKKVLWEWNFDIKFKESIALIVSITNWCLFCVNIHTENLKNHWLSDEEINWIKNAISNDEKLDFVLKFATTMTKDANNVSDKDFEILRWFWYSDENILEILTVIEMFTWYNKIVTALKIESND